MYCPNCGKSIPDDIKFCPECGENIEEYKALKKQKVVSEKVKEENVDSSSNRGMRIEDVFNINKNKRRF